MNRIDIYHRVTEGTKGSAGERLAPLDVIVDRTLLEIHPDFCGSPSPSTTRLSSCSSDPKYNEGMLITMR